MKALLKNLNIDEKFTKVRKPIEKEFNKVKHNIPDEPNVNLMADLLFLPTTKNGYKYLFVVVDLYTNQFDAEPIKDKGATTTKKALIKIFQYSQYIDPGIKALRTDDGTEFKGVFAKYLYDQNILHKIALPERHTQMANVESLNKQLGRLLNGYMNTREKQTGKVFKEWDEILPKVIEELNKIRKNNHQTIYPFFNPDKKSKIQSRRYSPRKIGPSRKCIGEKTTNIKI